MMAGTLMVWTLDADMDVETASALARLWPSFRSAGRQVDVGGGAV